MCDLDVPAEQARSVELELGISNIGVEKKSVASAKKSCVVQDISIGSGRWFDPVLRPNLPSLS